MLFTSEMLGKIASGAVTQAFRRWRRPTVRAGGTLRTAVGVLAIEAVEPVEVRDISDADALAAGFDGAGSLQATLLGRPGEGSFYRIRFRLAGADRRTALRLSPSIDAAARAELATALAKLDSRRPAPWTGAVLLRIGAQEGITAGELAAAVGMRKDELKRRIRALKELGLTESLAVGYRLSPRGRALLGGTEA